MNVAYFSDGRDWGHYIASRLASAAGKKWKISRIVTTPETEFPSGPLDKLGIKTDIVGHKELESMHKNGLFDGIDVMLFYGWSWMVPKSIVQDKICICLHPSPLPKYRGGSPIQHQIINGEKESAVTLFRMTDKMDAGPIYKQKAFSLEGHLRSVLERIGNVGLEITIEMLDEIAERGASPFVQDESGATTYKRRTKIASELTSEKLNAMGVTEMFNFIRALEDPYPNAYVKIADGTLLLKRAEIITQPQKEALQAGLLKNTHKSDITGKKVVIRCKDGGLISLEEVSELNP